MTNSAEQKINISELTGDEIIQHFNNNKSAAIRYMYSTGMKQYHIAKKLNIRPQFVSNTVNRPLKKV